MHPRIDCRDRQWTHGPSSRRSGHLCAVFAGVLSGADPMLSFGWRVARVSRPALPPRALAPAFQRDLSSIMERVQVFLVAELCDKETVAESFGFVPSPQSSAAKRQLDQQQKEMSKMMKTLWDSETFKIADFKGLIDKGLGGWASYIPGVQSTDNYQVLKHQQEVLACLTPEELDSLGENIGRKAKLRIAEKMDMSVTEVNDILHQYTCLFQLQRWLHEQKKMAAHEAPNEASIDIAGLTVPQSPEEMDVRLKSNPRGYDANVIRRIKRRKPREAMVHHMLKEKHRVKY
eukprot:scaffold819_cov239-Pinguiococcus_pyrenoidosus.AAC.2